MLELIEGHFLKSGFEVQESLIQYFTQNSFYFVLLNANH